MTDQAHPPVIELRGVGMAFAKPSGKPLQVLADINLFLREGEILGLLGRSGSGKSTLLRIAAGLVRPTTGNVLYRDALLEGPAPGIAVVFQSFALFPWLTVLENVALGLDALGLPRSDAHRRANAAIDLIGLDGFQSAYPRELSGGMRQRVGFARALVTDPVLLLMDEPFSALDVLTAEALRTDFLDLWVERRLPTKAVLLVTHNIDEAVLLCDRILVLSSAPGRLAAEIPVVLPHPRNRIDAEFRAVVDELYSILTARALASIAAQSQVHGGLVRPLPQASTNEISGLLETLVAPPHDGHADLADMAAAVVLERDRLFATAEALHILEFAELKDGSLKLTAAGRVFAESGTEERKRLFREHLLRFVPLAAHIRRVLDEREGHRAPRVRFEAELEDHLNRHDAEKMLRVITGWGRYAELFSYDDKTRSFGVGVMAP